MATYEGDTVVMLEWLSVVGRAQHFRRTLTFSQRQIFDNELRPVAVGVQVAYPDAFYHLKLDDFYRAMKAALL